MRQDSLLRKGIAVYYSFDGFKGFWRGVRAFLRWFIEPSLHTFGAERR
jgi:hypothetical protein